MMYLKFPSGLIEVITGPMFSGKSEELIKRIKILQYAKVKTLVVKPKLEKRWNKDAIFSRAGTSIETISVTTARQILEKWTPDFQAVAIDEAQFFDAEIVKVVVKLADQGVRVVISGLDKNYLAQPFGAMPTLLAISDKVDKLIAVCVVCGAAATLTFRRKGGKELIQIGDKEYQARCRHCYRLGMEDKNEDC